MRSLLVLLLDGLGDRASPAHGGRTANEAADTPNLDALAARGSCGLLWPLGPGRAPSSEVAHWAMLGYRTEEFPGPGRAGGAGHGRLAARGRRARLRGAAAVERRDGALWATGRAGPEDAADARARWTRCRLVRAGGLTLRLDALLPERGEGVLRVTGGADDRVTDSDPFFRDRHPVMRPVPLVPEAAATARAAELWSRLVVRHRRGARWRSAR